MSIEICDENGTRLSVLGFDCCWQMEAGEQYQFRYHIANQSGDPEVVWTVSDHTVLHVDPNGCVTAMMAGSAQLTVKIKGSTIAHQKCSLTIQVSGSDPDAIIFNTLRIDDAKASDTRARQWLSSLNLPSDVVVRYFMGDIRHFEMVECTTPVSNWAKASIYGTNASFFGGTHNMSCAHVYNGESLQYKTNGNTMRIYDFENGSEEKSFSLLKFDQETKTPQIHTHYYITGEPDSPQKQEAIANMYFAIGGIDLFGGEELTERGFNIKFDNMYDGYKGAFSCTATRHRTVLGYDSTTGKTILAVIYREGSGNISAVSEDSNGEKLENLYDQITLFQTRQIMKYLHCDMILNLDGGRSSCISFKDRESVENRYIANVNSNVRVRINIKPDKNNQIIWTE